MFSPKETIWARVQLASSPRTNFRSEKASPLSPFGGLIGVKSNSKPGRSADRKFAASLPGRYAP